MLIPGLTALLAGCGPDPLEAALGPLQVPLPRDILPADFVGLVLRADQVAVLSVGQPGPSRVHALDPAHPELAEALWPLALAEAAGPMVLFLAPDADPELGATALRAAGQAGLEPRLVVRVRP